MTSNTPAPTVVVTIVVIVVTIVLETAAAVGDIIVRSEPSDSTLTK